MFRACVELERDFEEMYKKYYMCLNCFLPYNVKMNGLIDQELADEPDKDLGISFRQNK
jgi:hypothetical protein